MWRRWRYRKNMALFSVILLLVPEKSGFVVRILMWIVSISTRIREHRGGAILSLVQTSTSARPKIFKNGNFSWRVPQLRMLWKKSGSNHINGMWDWSELVAAFHRFCQNRLSSFVAVRHQVLSDVYFFVWYICNLFQLFLVWTWHMFHFDCCTFFIFYWWRGFHEHNKYSSTQCFLRILTITYRIDRMQFDWFI